MSKSLSWRALLAIMACELSTIVAAQFGEPQQGCHRNSADCDGVFVLPGYVRLFQTFVPLRDTAQARAEYQRLLPPGFHMPDYPGFMYTFNDAHVGTELMEVDRAVAYLGTLAGQAPAGTAWRETGVLMTAAYTNTDGETRQGTYELGFSTDGLVGYLGRPSYPKYYADISYESTVAGGFPNAIGSLTNLIGPGESWTSASFVAGPSTDGQSEPTQMATFDPADVQIPYVLTREASPLDWRLNPSIVDGGGTHQGPEVIQNEVQYQEALPLAFVLGRDLQPFVVPGLTAPDVRTGLVSLKVDPRFHRFDEQSPEPMPDEVWHDIDLSKMIDLEGVYPGVMINGQTMLVANSERVAGRGGCASIGNCREALQVRPQDEPNAEPFSNSFLSPGLYDGTACIATSDPAGLGNSCSFTTDRPDGSPVVGIVSATPGSFELRAAQSHCRIWARDRHFSASNGIVQQQEGVDVLRANGAGVSLLELDDQCSYSLIVAGNGIGPVYAGQTHGTGAPSEAGADPANASNDGDHTGSLNANRSTQSDNTARGGGSVGLWSLLLLGFTGYRRRVGVQELAGMDRDKPGNIMQTSNRSARGPLLLTVTFLTACGSGASDTTRSTPSTPHTHDLATAVNITPEAMPGCANPVAPGGEWPSYGHDLANTRSQPLEDRIGPDNVQSLTPHFIFDTTAYSTVDGQDTPRAFNGPFFNTPTVADGCVYNAASDGTIFAINADTGELVWENDIEDDFGYAHSNGGGPTIGSVTVDQQRNRIFVLVSGEGDPREQPGSGASGDPYVAALDQVTGAVIWRSPSVTPQDDLDGEYDDALTYTLSGAVVSENTVIISFGGNATQRFYRGGTAFVDADSGELLKITNLLTRADMEEEFSGGSIWGTGVVDPNTKTFYIGTGNPSASTREHPYTNAIVKHDIDRNSPTFGDIIASGKGDEDQYISGLQGVQEPACLAVGTSIPYPGNSAACAQLDLDFGASPNLFHAPDGRLLVGALQKSGNFYVFDAATMEREWILPMGAPCFPCNTASSAVVDGRVFAIGAPARLIYGMEAGRHVWLAPLINVGLIHYQALSAANGIVYTYDGSALNGWDTETGELLLFQILDQEALIPSIDGDQLAEVLGGNLSHPATAALLNSDSSGIAIARNTLYVASKNRIYAMRLP